MQFITPEIKFNRMIERRTAELQWARENMGHESVCNKTKFIADGLTRAIEEREENSALYCNHCERWTCDGIDAVIEIGVPDTEDLGVTYQICIDCLRKAVKLFEEGQAEGGY
jgi:hypothetical protein